MANWEEVEIAIEEEREYQIDKWGATDERNTLGDFILYMTRELEKARDIYVSPCEDLSQALSGVRKVTALGVAAMERYGTGISRKQAKRRLDEVNRR